MLRYQMSLTLFTMTLIQLVAKVGRDASKTTLTRNLSSPGLSSKTNMCTASMDNIDHLQPIQISASMLLKIKKNLQVEILLVKVLIN